MGIYPYRYQHTKVQLVQLLRVFSEVFVYIQDNSRENHQLESSLTSNHSYIWQSASLVIDQHPSLQLSSDIASQSHVDSNQHLTKDVTIPHPQHLD